MLHLKGKVRPGVLDPPSNVKGRDLLESGCKGNDASCCYRLSLIYLLGKHSFHRDLGEAFKYAKKGCELGSIYSCINLSQMYKRGEGTEKNEELAQQYKKRAQDMDRDRKKTVEIEFQNTS